MNSAQRVERAKKLLAELYDLAYHLPAIGPEHRRLLDALAITSKAFDTLDAALHGTKGERK